MSPKWQQALLENATRLGSAEQAGEIAKRRNKKTRLRGGGAKTRKWAIQRAHHQRKALTLANKKEKDFEQISQQIILSRKYT
jgi:hypothetical protein